MSNLNFRDLDRDLIKGAIDLHVHTTPCPFPRPFDDAEAAALARDLGLRALVVKDHHQPTTGRVHHAQKLVSGVELLGTLVLNTYVGGLNPYAVEAAVRFYGARIIWLPTVTAANHLRVFGQPSFDVYDVSFRPITGITVTREGELLQEVREIIQICKEEDVCLCTGHISAAETRAVIKEAQRQGFRKLLVTHPLFPVPGLTLAEQKEFAATEGVFVEYTFLTMTAMTFTANARETAKIIREVGVDKCVMSTDLGNWFNPSPAEGFRCFIQSMLHSGIKPEEIEIMAKKNPRYLLNLN